jgi:hypothetical protein
MRGAAIKRIVFGFIMTHLIADLIFIRHLLPYPAGAVCPSQPELLTFRKSMLIIQANIIVPIAIELWVVVIRLFRHSHDG